MLLKPSPPPPGAPVITVDGPSGSGKGTVSSQLAKELGWHFLDSGAIYRALAFIAQFTSTPLEENKLLPLVEQLQLSVCPTNDRLSIVWKQRDITEAIRTETVGHLASQLAVYPKLRKALLSYQRAFRKTPGLVADGRDMGTVVFPNAVLKVFLFATLEERAKRRYSQLKVRGKHVSLSATQSALEQRDSQDKQRAAAPLRAAADAFVIDTTHLSVQDVLQMIKNKLQN